MLDAVSPWTGQLLLRPGVACPGNLTSTRPDVVARLTHGRAAHELPELLASLFNLCGGAHRLCAEMAVQAARGEPGTFTAAQAERLRCDTLREHLRRMGLDWPRQLAAPDDQAQAAHDGLRALRSGLVPIAAPHASWVAQRDDITDWLARDWLGLPADTWLQAWERGPREWLDVWSALHDRWLPQLLCGARAAADRLSPPAAALQLHARPADLQTLAACLQQPGFARQPSWQGHGAETGPWTRLHERDVASLQTPWLRLGARVAEAVRLALPDAVGTSGTGWLQAGHLALPGHVGIAWVEMSRGLLIHCVTLDGAGAQARVQSCRVVAPTDWNFHPRGAVAQALAQLPRASDAQREPLILALMAAYDPCVPFVIEPEPCHA